ncbi:MAG: nucleoside deaminase [Gammaproteobacteria bacterium]|nr:nucleoside deaminase [Gammaproteobacteria bacterium]
MEKKFIDAAILLAHQSVTDHKGGPFGAVIVKDRQIIGRGSNQVTSHNDPTAHAEIEAIRDACQNIQSFSLSGCTLYSSSEPCPMCLSAIYWARIECVYFANTYQQASQIGFDDQYIFKELSLPHQHKNLAISQVTDESVLFDALRVFQAWESSQFKQPY